MLTLTLNASSLQYSFTSAKTQHKIVQRYYNCDLVGNTSTCWSHIIAMYLAHNIGISWGKHKI